MSISFLLGCRNIFSILYLKFDLIEFCLESTKTMRPYWLYIDKLRSADYTNV